MSPMKHISTPVWHSLMFPAVSHCFLPENIFELETPSQWVTEKADQLVGTAGDQIVGLLDSKAFIKHTLCARNCAGGWVHKEK